MIEKDVEEEGLQASCKEHVEKSWPCRRFTPVEGAINTSNTTCIDMSSWCLASRRQDRRRSPKRSACSLALATCRIDCSK